MSAQDRIKRLSEERLRAFEEAKELIDTAEAEKRDFTAEESEKFDRINAALDEKRAQIDELAEFERRERSVSESLRDLGITPEKRKEAAPAKPSVDEQFRALARGEIRSFGVSAAEFRDLTTQTAGSGGNTIPTSFYGQLYEHMIATAELVNYATVLTTDGGEALEIPKTATKSSAAIIAENTTITESDPSFGKVTLNAYKYATAFQLPSELLEDTGVDLTGFLARQAGEAIGNDLGEDLVIGNGSSKPNGLTNASTLGVTGATTGASGLFTADELIDLYYSVLNKYRRSRGAAWIMRDATVGKVRKLKDSNNQYLWVGGFAAQPDTILGKPVIADPYVAAVATSAKSVAFGDMRAYWVRMVGGIKFERSDEFAFGSDQITFRAKLRADGDLVDTTGAVKHYVGAAT